MARWDSGLVSADRPLRLPPGAGRLHRLPQRLLPALSPRPGAIALAGRARRWRPGCCCRCAPWRCPVRHPPPDDARARAAGVGSGVGDGRAGGDAARMAVLATAFAPMAFFLSAVYSESLYLALSVGLFWSAREGRWALRRRAGGAGGGDAQRGRGAARAGADALPVRPSRGSPAGPGPRGRAAAPALARPRASPPSRTPAPSPPSAAEPLCDSPLATACEPMCCGSPWSPPASSCTGLPGGLAVGIRWLRSRPGRVGPALRGPLRGGVGRDQGGLRGSPPAAVDAADARVLPGGRRRPVRGRQPQPDPARLPGCRGAGGGGGAAQAPARLRRLPARRRWRCRSPIPSAPSR